MRLVQPALYVNRPYYYSKPTVLKVLILVSHFMKNAFIFFAFMTLEFDVCGQVPDLVQVEKAWKRHKTYTIELLDAFPEEKLSFRPSKESRSFAELMVHIAQSNYGFSTMIVGQPIPSAEVFDVKGKSKNQVRLILADSFDYLLKHIGTVKPEAWGDSFPWGNRLEPATKRTRLEVFTILKEHAAHHRGQATVYLRLNGIEPPSFID